MGWMIFRLVASLLFVAAVLWFASRVAKKRGLGRGANLIEVLARQPMGRTSSVNVIRVADRVFLVGSTEAQITLLGEMDESTVAEALADPNEDGTSGSSGLLAGSVGGSAPVSPLVAGSVFDRSTWASLMQGLRDKTVRKS